MRFHTLLIDADILLHRAVCVGATTVVFDEVAHTEVDLRKAGAYMRDTLQGWKRQFGAQRALLAVGDPTRNYFRKELAPSYYKSHRPALRLPGYQELEAKLKAHAKVIQIARLEGDDVLGCMLTKPGVESRLCISIDHDMLQVPGWHYDPDKELLRETTPEEGTQRHLLQTLTGDRGDGYPGCPGVGPVKAARVLAGESTTRWERVVAAFEKTIPQLDDDAGTPALWDRAERAALLQARLAFVLRQGYYSTKTKEITLWTPT